MFPSAAAAAYRENEFSGQLNDFHISNGIRAKVSRKPPPSLVLLLRRDGGGEHYITVIYIYMRLYTHTFIYIRGCRKERGRRRAVG